MNKKKFGCLMALISALVFGAVFQNGDIYAAEYKTITDMDGQRVEVPVNPEKVACMHCIAGGMAMILGEGRRIRLMEAQSPWAYKFFPEIKGAASNEKVAPEEMSAMGIDLVFYTPGMNRGEPYRKAGLKAACSFSSEKAPRTVDGVMEGFERQMGFFGEALSPAAAEKAKRYNAYMDKKVKEILSVTSKLAAGERPKVYYGGKAGKPLASQGNASVLHWNVEVAGGIFLPADLGGGKVAATMPQVTAWKPEVVLMSGDCDSLDVVTKDSEWAGLDAVKAGKVYLLPVGIFSWDYVSGENVLLMIHLAKLFHPDLFKNWDMIREMKTFYAEVYGITVSDGDAERILNHLPPI